MGKDLLLVIETVANEKDISRSILFEAMEEALAIAVKKRFTDDVKIVVKIDRKTGEYKTFRQWYIVAEDYDVKNYAYELYIDVAKEKGYNVKVHDIFEELIESVEFGRIAAMAAKQIIMQKVRDEERRLMISRFKDKVGHIIYGEVKRNTRDFIIVDLGDNAEGILYRKDLLPKDHFRVNDKIRSCISKIDEEIKGYQIFLTRIDKKMLYALLLLEVPEIAEELMDIVNIERDPGSRSKVAVKSNDKRIDPVGSCVGMRGSRIQVITNELQGEKIDIVLWDENPAQYVINSIGPAEVISILQDEDAQSMQVAVKEDQLSQAIGRNGQNVRLASLLTGWNINIMAESVAQEKQKKEIEEVVTLFVDTLRIDRSVAEVLVNEGYTMLEEVAYVKYDEMLKIDSFDDEMVRELQERAKEVLNSDGLGSGISENLLLMEGMSFNWAKMLAKKGIIKMENLAELAVDDLQEIIPISKKEAASLIMTARAPWFKDVND